MSCYRKLNNDVPVLCTGSWERLSVHEIILLNTKILVQDLKIIDHNVLFFFFGNPRVNPTVFFFPLFDLSENKWLSLNYCKKKRNRVTGLETVYRWDLLLLCSFISKIKSLTTELVDLFKLYCSSFVSNL